MVRLMIAAAMAVGVAMPAMAEPHTPKPGGCISLEATKATAEEIAKQDGGTFTSFDGDAAKKLIAAINAIGKPSEFRADHLGLILVKDTGKGLVLMASDPCGYSLAAIVMPISDIMKATAFALGEQM